MPSRPFFLFAPGAGAPSTSRWIVQGRRDPLCPLDKLAAVRPRMTAPNHLVVVEGGDHSLEVSAQQRKAAGETQSDSDARVLAAIASFVKSLS